MLEEIVKFEEQDRSLSGELKLEKQSCTKETQVVLPIYKEVI
jgi:hypothetical protein